jgi:hypothetical protein
MKDLARRSIIASFLMLTTIAHASTWNFALVGDDEVRYFFDSDTVVKTRDRNILMWVKTVKTTKAYSDGSWSIAYRWKINCSKKTLQTLAWSSYGNDGKFIRSGSTLGVEEEVVPDSVGEAMLKIACESNFPNDKSSNSYFKLEGMDVFQATRNYVEHIKSQVDSAPK